MAVACCAGPPLIATAGISIAAPAWVGRIALGAVALIAGAVALSIRVRTRRRGGSSALPPGRQTS